MIRRALASAVRALSRPAPVAAITVATAIVSGTNVLIGKPRTMELALVSLGTGVVRWALLIGIQAVALGMVRAEADASSRAWVAPAKLLKLALVSIAGGIAAMVVVFAAVTLWLALKPIEPVGVVVIAVIAAATLYAIVVTSQYVLLILDDDGVDAIEAVALSIDLTKGHRLELLGLVAVMAVLAFSLMVGIFVAGHKLDPTTLKTVIAALAAFSAPIASCVNAAVYIELLRDRDARLEGVAADLAGHQSGSLPSSI